MTIEIPYFPLVQDKSSDSLHDFYINICNLINFFQESLMLYSVSRNLTLPDKIAAINGRTHFQIYQIPDIIINNRIDYQSDNYPLYLFYNHIVNISSLYEIYIRDIANEVIWANSELLSNDEKQLTTKEILSYNNLEDLRIELTDRATNKLIMSQYPNLVHKFNKKFHVGIHCEKSPMTLFEMHHFLEVRNIIVHNDGRASSIFYKRLNDYCLPSPLGIKGELCSPNLDFDYIIKFKDKLISLVEYIDKEVTKKWGGADNDSKNLFSRFITK